MNDLTHHAKWRETQSRPAIWGAATGVAKVWFWGVGTRVVSGVRLHPVTP